MSKILKSFNKNIGEFSLKPMLIDSKDDYIFYKEIMTDKELMKAVSLFGGAIPSEKK